MKKITLLLFLAQLCSCANMQDTRKEANRIELLVNKSYQSSYRLTMQSITNHCEFLLESIKNAEFTDINQANITQSQHMVVGWTLDFIKIDDNSSKIVFYTDYQAQRKYAQRLQYAINNNATGCFFDDLQSKN